MRNSLVISLFLFVSTVFSQSIKTPHHLFDIIVDSTLIGKKIYVKQCAVVGMPYALACKHMEEFHKIQLTLYSTNYDTMYFYVKKLVKLKGFILGSVTFEDIQSKYKIAEQDTAFGAYVLYRYERSGK